MAHTEPLVILLLLLFTQVHTAGGNELGVRRRACRFKRHQRASFTCTVHTRTPLTSPPPRPRFLSPSIFSSFLFITERRPLLPLPLYIYRALHRGTHISFYLCPRFFFFFFSFCQKLLRILNSVDTYTAFGPDIHIIKKTLRFLH